MENSVLYVGIGGKKRHGKDTVARILWKRIHNADTSQRYRVVRRALADSLKEEVACFLCGQLQGSLRWNHDPVNRIEKIMENMNSDEHSEKECFRLLLQWWGTEFRRQMFREDYWIRALEEWVANWAQLFAVSKPLIVIVPDVRMKNEAQFIRDRGGVLIKVVRSRMNDTDTHASETELDTYIGWDAIVPNDSLEDLEEQVRVVQEGLLTDRIREMFGHG